MNSEDRFKDPDLVTYRLMYYVGILFYVISFVSFSAPFVFISVSYVFLLVGAIFLLVGRAAINYSLIVLENREYLRRHVIWCLISVAALLASFMLLGASFAEIGVYIAIPLFLAHLVNVTAPTKFE